jgi:predicted outer membrane repeat protein
LNGVATALGACALLLALASPAPAATFTVINGNDSGTGSLRQAIDDAESNNNDPTVDLIEFTYTGNINLETDQINVSHPLTIDGPGPSNLNVTRGSAASTPFRFFALTPAASDTITIRDLTISGARASNFAGGALIMDGLGTLVIDSVAFDDNRVTPNGSGGAVLYDRGFTSIRNSTFTNNQADFGGAVLGSQFTPDVGNGDVVNSTFAGNKATSFGGAIYTNVSHIQILSSTFMGNVADSDGSSPDNGGGTYNGASDTLDFSVANTLYAGNLSGSSTPVANQCGGAHTSFGYNLRETSDVDCTGFTQTGDAVFSDASLLGILGANGGPTPTIALLTGNPAIDHGNDVLALGGAFPACPATDQRGFLRGGAAGRCDIGAFELNATPPSSGGGGSTPPPATVVATPFNVKAAIKKCKKKFPKGPKRKKCIKRAKKRAQG